MEAFPAVPRIKVTLVSLSEDYPCFTYGLGRNSNIVQQYFGLLVNKTFGYIQENKNILRHVLPAEHHCKVLSNQVVLFKPEPISEKNNSFINIFSEHNIKTNSGHSYIKLGIKTDLVTITTITHHTVKRLFSQKGCIPLDFALAYLHWYCYCSSFLIPSPSNIQAKHWPMLSSILRTNQDDTFENLMGFQQSILSLCLLHY